jgi:hypothetical protein
LETNAFHEAEEPDPEHIVRTMRDFNLTEALLVTETGIRLSADINCNEARAVAAGQRIVRMFVFLL